jgi:hypothetical protein
MEPLVEERKYQEGKNQIKSSAVTSFLKISKWFMTGLNCIKYFGEKTKSMAVSKNLYKLKVLVHFVFL